MALKNRISEIAVLRGLNMTELANILGVSKQTMYFHLRNESVTTKILERYANALNVPVWFLLTTKEEASQFLKLNNTTNTANDNGETVLLCPHCNKPIKVNITPTNEK